MISMVSGTYNRIKLLQRMIKSARASVGTLAYEFVIIDGGSTDGTIEWCIAQPDIVLIQHGKLLGAIKAYNDGCYKAQGEYVVILNDDAVVEGNTIGRAYQFMRTNPDVGQGAFGHKYQRRGSDKTHPCIQKAYGYVYGQCSMIRKWLGDCAGWWGEGYHTYAGDTRLSMRLWEMGWKVVPIEGCAVIDFEHNDALRQHNNTIGRGMGGTNTHRDSVIFHKRWKDRLPKPVAWISHPVSMVVEKAVDGTLRTLRFKAMSAKLPERTALIDAFAQYGPTRQVNQGVEMQQHGDGFQSRAEEIISKFRPDLVLFQIQRDNNIQIETLRRIRKANPHTTFVNFDGDSHRPLERFNFEIAKLVDLQLIISPTMFPEYIKNGVTNVAYWPIGIEDEYLLPASRGPEFDVDLTFLGHMYGIGKFWEAENRRDVVKALVAAIPNTAILGNGWQRVGIKSKHTSEQHGANAERYRMSKLALSISQASHLWGYTSDRLYNICGTGCAALVQRFAGMEAHGFIDGVTCIVWATFDEAVAQAKYYIAHDEERERIGEAGRQLVHTRHTWGSRVESLFAMLDGLEHNV